MCFNDMLTYHVDMLLDMKYAAFAHIQWINMLSCSQILPRDSTGAFETHAHSLVHGPSGPGRLHEDIRVRHYAWHQLAIVNTTPHGVDML